MTPRIGIDLGGTKIEAIALDGDGGALLRERRPTPRDDLDGSLEVVAALVADFEAELGVRATVGVGIPGSVSPADGLIRNANSTWLIGRDLKGAMEARLERPVRLENDANCLALSEAVDGAGAGERVVFAVILGTGTGGGIALDGRPLIGRNAIAGEWGHNPLPWPGPEELPGPDCYCGRRGCLETFLSGPGLADDHRRATGATLRPEAIVEAAAGGDTAARATLARHRDRLGRGLAAVVNLLDPDVVVLGGGISNLPGLVEALPAAMAPHVFSDLCTTPLRRAAHGDSSGVRGAAWLWGPGETDDHEQGKD